MRLTLPWLSGLYTLNDVLKHYVTDDREISKFLDELTEPTPGNVWVSHEHSDCVKIILSNIDTNNLNISKPNVQNGIVVYLPVIPFMSMKYCKIVEIDNAEMKYDPAHQIDGDSEAQNFVY